MNNSAEFRVLTFIAARSNVPINFNTEFLAVGRRILRYTRVNMIYSHLRWVGTIRPPSFWKA